MHILVLLIALAHGDDTATSNAPIGPATYERVVEWEDDLRRAEHRHRRSVIWIAVGAPVAALGLLGLVAVASVPASTPVERQERSQALAVAGFLVAGGTVSVVIGVQQRSSLRRRIDTLDARLGSVHDALRSEVEALGPTFRVGAWSVSMTAGGLDGRREVVAVTEGPEVVEAWLADRVPRLAVRCRDGQLGVYVVPGMVPDPGIDRFGHASVRLRVDDGPIRPLVAGDSDGKGIFFREPEALTVELLRAKSVTFEFTPFQDAPGSTTFALDEMATAFKPLWLACWPGTER